MRDPTPELTDDTPIEELGLTTRVRNALMHGGFKTVGEVREASDKTLLSLQDMGQTSVDYLRQSLGLASEDGVRPSHHTGNAL